MTQGKKREKVVLITKKLVITVNKTPSSIQLNVASPLFQVDKMGSGIISLWQNDNYSKHRHSTKYEPQFSSYSPIK